MIAVRGRRASTVLIALAALLAPLAAGCASVRPSVATTAVFGGVTWPVGERLEYRLRNAAGEELGRGLLTTERAGERLLLRQQYSGVVSGGTPPRSDVIALTVDAKTLAPVQGTRETSGRDDAGNASTQRTAWAYRLDGARLRLDVNVEGSGETESSDLGVQPAAYDNESSLWLWRGIPFVEGYEAAYVSVNPHDGSRQTVSVRAPQQEEITVPAGTFKTWRVLFRSGRAVRTAWISIAAPHHVVRWDNGSTIFDLAKVE